MHRTSVPSYFVDNEGLKISTFIFYFGAILGVFSPPQKAFFAARTLLKIPLLFEKKVKNEKFFADFLEKLLSYPGVFFGHLGTT